MLYTCEYFYNNSAAIFLACGIAYIYKSASIKNHCSDMQKKVAELNTDNKIMLFALMRGAGGGAIALATTIIWLQLAYTKYNLHGIPWLFLFPLLFFLRCQQTLC
jgi:hypothetical protein